MEKVILKAELREEKGKSSVKKLRKNKIIPAVIYKGGNESIAIKLDKSDVFHVLHTSAGENVLITLRISGEKKDKDRTCIIKEIQRDAVKDDIIHLDLNEISLTEKIEVKVPIHSHGEPIGVTKDEGVLDHALWEVEIECLPTDIPKEIEVEVSQMNIGDTIFIKDIQAPPGVKILNDPDLTVLSVVPPAKEEVVEEAPEEGAEEPEVISKGKKEEEEIPEGEGEKKPAKEEKPAAVPPKKEEKKG